MSRYTRHFGSGDPDADKLVITYTGNGSATFDPSFTTSKATKMCLRASDGTYLETASGTSHAFSYTPAAGTFTCRIWGAAGLGAITAIDCNTDAITTIRNIEKCSNLSSLTCYGNVGLVINLDAFQLLTALSANSLLTLHGTTKGVSRIIQSMRCNKAQITGSVSDIPASINSALSLFETQITAGSISQLINARTIDFSSVGWLTASVNTVIDSMWAARATYTYASGPTCQIGGTNGDPSGNIVAPIEGTDWHEDTPGHWTPLTPGAMIYDLLNDVNSEGFNTWTSIST